MINTDVKQIHVVWLEEEKQFFMYAKLTEGLLHNEMWVAKLFNWHKESYYGTFLPEDANKTGVYLSPLMALTYFADDHASSTFSFIWNEVASWLRAYGPMIYGELTNGHMRPDYEAWRDGKQRWRLPALTDIPDPFSLLHQWLPSVYYEWANAHPDVQAKWEQVTAHPLFTGQMMLPIFDETDWLIKIGWQDDTFPFTFGVRLTEPEQENAMWQLSLFLRNKEKRNTTYELTSKSALPEKWQQPELMERVDQQQTMLLHIEPQLADETGDFIKHDLTEQEAWLFLTKTSLDIAETGMEVLLPYWWKSLQNQRTMVKAAVQSSHQSAQSFVGMNALVDFNWKIATQDIELSEQEFLTIVEQRRNLIQKNGKWMKLDPAFIKKMQTFMKKVEKDGLTLRDVLEKQMGEQTTPVDDETDISFDHIDIELNGQLLEIITKLQHTAKIPEITVSKTLNGQLRPYQKQGVEWLLFLREYGLGACLADDMGLGKTIQMITYLIQTKEKSKTATPSLIICPTSVLGNWQKELQKFAPTLNVYMHYGANREKDENFTATVHDYDVVLTSYTLATIDKKNLQSVTWDSITLDEAQNIKNADTKQSKAIRKLTSTHKIALTGTPIENRLTELWAIFDFINHGYFGSLTNFQKRFAVPIEKENNRQKIEQIQKLVQPFLLRRTKKDESVSLNLPEKQEQKEYCALTLEQATLYEQVIQDTFKEMEQLSGFKRRGLILGMLTKLKQICNHPFLYLKEEVNGTPSSLIDRSLKLEKLVELAENIQDQGESCLIFTQYIDMGHMIQHLLQTKTKGQALFLHGGLSKEKRDQMVDRFQNGEVATLILSLRAGGTGLNLTAANHVIHYDRWWNPAVENQATDRAYRIGQKRFVHVHKLITTGTLEEKIDDMLERKQTLSEEIISGESWMTELSTTELHELLALK